MAWPPPGWVSPSTIQERLISVSAGQAGDYPISYTKFSTYTCLSNNSICLWDPSCVSEIQALQALARTRLLCHVNACPGGAPVSPKPVCRNLKAWNGSTPSTLLESVIRPEACTQAVSIESKPQPDGSLWQACGTVTLVGQEEDPMTTFAAGCSSEAVATQQASLQLLHIYQDKFLELFCRPPLNGDESVAAAEMNSGCPSDTACLPLLQLFKHQECQCNP